MRSVRFVLSWTPGTASFRGRYRREMARCMRLTMQGLTALETLDAGRQRRLRPAFRASYKQLAGVHALQNGLQRSVQALVIVDFALGLLLAPAVAFWALSPEFSWQTWIWVGACYAAVAWLPAFLFAVAPFKSKNLVFAWLVLSAVAVGLLVWASTLLPATLEYVAISAMTAPVLVLAGVGGTFVLWAASYIAGSHILRRVAPEAVVVDGLAGLLLRVERTGRLWHTLPVKRELMARLEMVARTLEHDLPRHLPGADPATDVWLKDRAAQWAAAVRAQKKALLPAATESRDQLIEWLAVNLERTATRDWTALDCVEPERLERPERTSLAVDLVMTVVRGALPAVLFFGVQQTRFALDGAAAGYVAAAVLAWAAITLLARIDPLFSQKLSALKDIDQYLPRPKP